MRGHSWYRQNFLGAPVEHIFMAKDLVLMPEDLILMQFEDLC